MKKVTEYFCAFVLGLVLANLILAAPVERKAAGDSPAAIQSAVDQFRADLGGNNNGVGAPQPNGRREINWDGAPDTVSSPNNMPFTAFQNRGTIFHSTAAIAGDNPFILSADASNPANAAVNYGDIDPSYVNIFKTFSAERLFVARDSNIIEVLFFIPGTRIPATVNGFGAVFTDVDGTQNTFIEFYDARGNSLGETFPNPANNGLSFAGVSFNAGERISKVVIKLGNAPLATGNVDGVNGIDVVATDDFIFGEPRAASQHPQDYDGDGAADFAVFRPSSGSWFVLNSGNSTFQATQFGQNGDVPVGGDFDGDGRNDLAVFRPSIGSWLIQNSSNNQFVGIPFGAAEDKPIPGDYDRDGKTDVAVWRPSTGNYFLIRSSNNQFVGLPWGTNGDIPLGSSLVP